ncbi:MAG: Mbov_0395 family pilin-like conjugal transfer protein [Candidatus Saccharimonadales bacterium]
MSGLWMFFAQGVANPFPKVTAGSSTLTSLLSLLFAAAGGISVLFIVIGGFRYILSAGDPQDASQAKNTILYAVIGLIISVSAYAIVSFVLGKL